VHAVVMRIVREDSAAIISDASIWYNSRAR